MNPVHTATKEDYMQRELAQQLNLPSLAPNDLPPQDINSGYNSAPKISLGEVGWPLNINTSPYTIK